MDKVPPHQARHLYVYVECGTGLSLTLLEGDGRGGGEEDGRVPYSVTDVGGEGRMEEMIVKEEEEVM